MDLEQLQQRCLVVRRSGNTPAENFNKSQLQLGLTEGYEEIAPIPGGAFLVRLFDSQCVIFKI